MSFYEEVEALKEQELILIERTFKFIEPHGTQFAQDFYKKFFTMYPDVKPLFANVDQTHLVKMIWNALVLVIHNLKSPQQLQPSLISLGRRHMNYGVIGTHYLKMGEAIMATLEAYLRKEREWSDEVCTAWEHAYNLVSRLMQKGSGVLPRNISFTTHTSKAGSAPPDTPPSLRPTKKLEAKSSFRFDRKSSFTSDSLIRKQSFGSDSSRRPSFSSDTPRKRSSSGELSMRSPGGVARELLTSSDDHSEANASMTRIPSFAATPTGSSRRSRAESIPEEDGASSDDSPSGKTNSALKTPRARPIDDDAHGGDDEGDDEGDDDDDADEDGEYTYEIDVNLLRETFEQIKPNGLAFVRQFYSTLFENHGNLHTLFARIDQSHQEKKLLNILTLIVENIENADVLAGTLRGLGEKHVGFGVIPPYFKHMGEALIEIMHNYFDELEKKTGKQWWTMEAEESWRGAYAMVAGLLLEGYKQKSSGASGMKPPTSSASATPASSNTTPAPENRRNLFQRMLTVNLSSAEKKDDAASSDANTSGNTSPVPPPLSPRSAILAEFRRGSQSSAATGGGGGRGGVGGRGGGRGLTRSATARLRKQPSTRLNTDNTSPVLSRNNSSRSVGGNGGDASPAAAPVTVSSSFWSWWKPISLTSLYEEYGPWAQTWAMETYTAFTEAPMWVVVLGTIVIYLILTRMLPQTSWVSGFVESIEQISLMIGVILYLKEAPDRRKQFHYHAWGAIDGAASAKVSQTRIMALQDLNADGVSLRGFHGDGLDLSEVKLPNADLRQCQLNDARFDDCDLSHGDVSYASMNHASLVKAELHHIRMEFAHCVGANFNGANLENAKMFCADLTQANLSGANLRYASLKGVCFEGAVLAGADFTGADVDVRALSKGTLSSTRMPDGSMSPT